MLITKGGELQQFIVKLILMLSAVLSANSALAVSLSSVINNDTQQVEHGKHYQDNTSFYLVKRRKESPSTQIRKKSIYKEALYLLCLTQLDFFYENSLEKLLSTTTQQHYIIQKIAFISIGSEKRYLLSLPVNQIADKPSPYKRFVS